MRQGAGAWSPGILALSVVALLAVPSIVIFQRTGWGGAGRGGAPPGCDGVRSKVGSHGDPGGVPRGASLAVVLASRGPDVSWVQRAVEGVRALPGSSVLVYRLYGPPADEQSAAVVEEEWEEEDGLAPVALRRLPAGVAGQESAACLDAILAAYPRLPAVLACLRGYSTRHSRVGNDWVLQSLLRRRPTSLGGGYLPAQCREPGGEYGFTLRPANISANPEWLRPAARDLAQAWEELFGRHLGPLPPIVSAPAGSEFVASAAAVRRHPRAFYADLRGWLHASAMGPLRAERVLELAWHLLLQPHTQLAVHEHSCMCALYGVPAVRHWGGTLLAVLAVPPLLATAALLAGPMLRLARGPGQGPPADGPRRRPSAAALMQ